MDQSTTKSPPGPNLQSGAAYLSVSGLTIIEFLIPAPNSKERFTALVTIDKAPRMTQTKTEQKADKSRLFSGPRKFALLAQKIWDLEPQKNSLTFERVCPRAAPSLLVSRKR
jgi:hypothetical protein